MGASRAQARHQTQENPGHDDHDEDDYRGAATLVPGDADGADSAAIDVEVVLRGHFEPIDGRFHWYGRVAANQQVTDVAGGRKQQLILRTPHGEAVGTLSDPDPWGRYRITGVGRPPFAVNTELDDD